MLIWERLDGTGTLAVVADDGTARATPLGPLALPNVASQGDVAGVSWAEANELRLAQYRISDGRALTEPLVLGESLAHAHHGLVHRSGWNQYGVMYSHDAGSGQFVLRSVNVDCPYGR